LTQSRPTASRLNAVPLQLQPVLLAEGRDHICVLRRQKRLQSLAVPQRPFEAGLQRPSQGIASVKQRSKGRRGRRPTLNQKAVAADVSGGVYLSLAYCKALVWRCCIAWVWRSLAWAKRNASICHMRIQRPVVSSEQSPYFPPSLPPSGIRLRQTPSARAPGPAAGSLGGRPPPGPAADCRGRPKPLAAAGAPPPPVAALRPN
jgi:hypothetical protein